MIKNILLDLDETIFDFHKAEAIAISETLKRFDIKPTDKVVKRYSAINESQWKLLEQKLLTREQVLLGRFQILFDELDVDGEAMSARQIYEDLLSQGHYFIQGSEEALKKLYEEYDLYLVSNGTAKVQHGRLNSSDIQKYFKKIFISQEVGYDKPDVRFFEHCFGFIPDFKKDETIIVGDSLSSDILGGINAGIHTCWFNQNRSLNTSDIKPEIVISDLRQLQETLQR